jgi:transaldolase
VSLEVSPLLADDTDRTLGAARLLSTKAARSNLLIKIPGTPAGLPAIESAIFAGIPINVTLLFSPEQYIAAAEAYMRGLERRISLGLSPMVMSVASLFVSRWDKAVADKVPAELRNKLGIAMGQKAYCEYRRLLDSDRWQRLESLGARSQRLLFASTSTKDPQASDLLYVEALAAPNTVNTMPEPTLLSLADHGRIGPVLSPDGGDADRTLADFARAGIDLRLLANTLQREGVDSFAKSWHELLGRIETKGSQLVEHGAL